MADARPKTPEERTEVLKGIIRDLHGGADIAGLKKRFAELVRDVDASEISRMEQQLVAEGLPPEQIKKLCDVHVQVFKESLERQKAPGAQPGHPVHTFRAENEALSKLTEEITAVTQALGSPPSDSALSREREKLSELLDKLSEVNKHYLRKENQLFPFLEKHGVSGPTQVMWAIHDDVRGMLKKARTALDSGNAGTFAARVNEAAKTMNEMFYKEEKILFPMALDTLSDAEWAEMRAGEAELGYALVEPGSGWQPDLSRGPAPSAPPPPPTEEPQAAPGGKVPLSTGALTPEQVDLLLRHLPLDVTFVDEDDEVRYYSATDDRIFPRSPGIIGRKVQNCHPPDSLHVVNKILKAFRDGKRDTADFWIGLRGRLIYIRYFAMRAEDGGYRGTLEVSQDVTGIRELRGERRLLDWDE